MCEQVLSSDELLCEMPGREPTSFIWQSFLSDGLVPSGERPQNKGRKARSLAMQTLTHPPAFVSVPLSPFTVYVQAPESLWLNFSRGESSCLLAGLANRFSSYQSSILSLKRKKNFVSLVEKKQNKTNKKSLVLTCICFFTSEGDIFSIHLFAFYFFRFFF